jgi:hypothetical protein
MSAHKNGVAVLDKSKIYRPSDKEPFMNERQREYFRRKLVNWKNDILRESRETLESLQDQTDLLVARWELLAATIPRNARMPVRDFAKHLGEMLRLCCPRTSPAFLEEMRRKTSEVEAGVVRLVSVKKGGR